MASAIMTGRGAEALGWENLLVEVSASGPCVLAAITETQTEVSVRLLQDDELLVAGDRYSWIVALPANFGGRRSGWATAALAAVERKKWKATRWSRP